MEAVLPLSTLREALVHLDPQDDDPWAEDYVTLSDEVDSSLESSVSKSDPD